MKEQDLLPYQDIPRGCIKCGMDGDIGVYTKYIPLHKKGRKEVAEHLIRTCSQCGYQWHTKTKEG